MGIPKIVPSSAGQAPDVLELLQSSLLFKEADENTISSILPKLVRKTYKKGDPVFVENEMSNYVYFVSSGSVEIVSYKVNLRQLVRVKLMKAGDHFSEFSVLTRSNHSTSCFALEDTTLFMLDHQSFHDFLMKNSKVARGIVKTLARLNQQLTNTHNYIEYFKDHFVRFTPEIIKILPHNLLNKYGVIPVRLDRNTLVIAMKDPHNREFFEHFQSINPEIQLRVFVINESDFKSALKQMSRFYSGVGLQASAPPPFTHRTTRKDDPKELLKYTTFFSQLEDKLLMELFPHLEEKEFEAGQVIFEPGTASEYFYLIKNGSVDLLKVLSQGGSTGVATLGQGDSFSEISLITDSLHSLQARAKNKVSLYVLPKQKMDDFLNRPSFAIPLSKILAKRLQTLNRRTHIQYYPGELAANPLAYANLLPRSVIRENKILPLHVENKEVTLGVVNPEEDLIYVMINRYLPDYRIKVMLVNEEDFQISLKRIETEQTESSITTVKQVDTPHLRVVNNDSVKFLEGVLRDAVVNRASDLHLEPLETTFAIRFRIDGEMRELHEKTSKDLGNAVINRVKILSDLNIAEKRYPQDGQLKLKIGDLNVQARVSSVPSKFGEKIVMRLIQVRKGVIPLNMLAPDKETIKFLREVIRHKQGLFLISGPTGSGKTTTLYSVLTEINSIRSNVVTVEDPVELILPGCTQIEINEPIKLTYGRVLRHILRQDPDIIMVGEIRDAESAKIVFQATLTGHLVLATIHTNNSIDVVPRLIELGVHPSVISAGLVGVMAQRLVPSICKHCRDTKATTEEQMEILKRELKSGHFPEVLPYGKGCPKCHGTGYMDRLPVFEYWRKTPQIRDLIADEAAQSEFKAALKETDFRTLEQFGLDLARNGLTTVEQVERWLYGLSDL